MNDFEVAPSRSFYDVELEAIVRNSGLEVDQVW